MAETLREHCEKRLNGLKAIRQPYEAEWKEIARFTQPSRSRFLSSETNRNYRRTNRSIYNAHGILAFRTLAGGMTSGLSSPSRPWFRLTSFDEQGQADQDAKVWMAEVERRMYAFLARTNFYGAVKSGYAELGMFGTEACVMVPHHDPNVVAVCHPLTAGEYWVGVGDAAKPDTLYRRVPLTVIQLVNSFSYAKASKRVQDLYDKSSYDEVIEVIHAMEPNFDRQFDTMTAKSKPWISAYWECHGGDGEKTMLSDQGAEEQPFWAPRWDTVGGDAYGFSPAMEALPDLRELQMQTKRKREATDFLIKPEKIVNPQIKLTGEAGNIVSAATVDANSSVIVPYQIPYQAIAEIANDVKRAEDAIDRLSYADLFLAITNMEGIQPRNIEEIASRNEEKMTQLGPVIERVNNEKLEVAIDRTFGIMSRKGMLPPAPESLQGQQIKIDFVSILSQMQRMVGIGQTERIVSFIGNLAAAHPEALDKLNVDETIDDYADRAGASPKIIRTDDEVAKIRDARAQQQQAQQVASMMPAAKDGADAARLLSEAQKNGMALPGQDQMAA
jgi:hypothetical protein